MYFYKYQSLSPLSLMMLKRGEVYFASSNELNDRQECRATYLFNGSRDVWVRFVDYVLVELCIRYRLYGLPSDAQKLISLADSIYEKGFLDIRKRNLDITDVLKCMDIGFNEVLDDDFTDEEKQKISQYTEDFLYKLVDSELQEEKYITSFSKNAINPTMWGHYSGAETGFLIIYESEDGKVEVESSLVNLSGFREKDGYLEVGNYNKEKLSLKDVTYAKSPCKVNGFDRLLHLFRYTEQEDHYDVPSLLRGEIGTMQEEKVGLVKYTDWKYEKEIRLFFPTFDELPSEHRCLQVCSSQIKGVIFGAKISDSDKKKILMACFHLRETTSSDANFAILQAIDSPKQYSLDIVPVGFVDQLFYKKRLPIKPYEKLSKNEQEYLVKICREVKKQS